MFSLVLSNILSFLVLEHSFAKITLFFFPLNKTILHTVSTLNVIYLTAFCGFIDECWLHTLTINMFCFNRKHRCWSQWPRCQISGFCSSLDIFVAITTFNFPTFMLCHDSVAKNKDVIMNPIQIYSVSP